MTEVTSTVESSAAELTTGRRRREYLPRALFAVLFLVSWQLVAPILPTDQIPTPTAVGAFMIDELRGESIAPESVYSSFAITLLRLALGLVITFLLGAIVGIAMGVSQRAEAFFHDFVIGNLALPYVIWALVIAMWLGLGFITPVIVVVLATMSFVITNVAEGVRNVPSELVDMARAYNVPPPRLMRQLIIPSLMPFVFAAFRYAQSLGWKALAVAEVFGATAGAGWMLRFWYQSGRTTGLFAYLAFFIIIAIIIDFVVLRRLSRRVFRWRESAGGA